MAESKENRELIYENELRAKLLQGAKAAHDAVSTTYGVRGKNVIIERGFGRPTFTRDGVTVVEQVYFSDRVQNMGAQILAEASRTANNVSGDGSSATVILGYHLFNNAVKEVSNGKHPMDVSDTITKDGYKILEALESEAQKVEDKQLKDVATVSAGDPLIGELIADAILYVGEDGGILTEKAPIEEIEREFVDGYYLQSGFTALQAGNKEIVDPYVVVSQKRIGSRADATDLLNGIARNMGAVPGQPLQQVPRILFVGNFEDAAYFTIVDAINKGMIDAVIIKTPPMYGELGKYLLEDIALYAGCELIRDTTNLKEFVRVQHGTSKVSSSFIGTVNKVVASKTDATVFGDNETERVQTRIAEIKDQIESEDIPAVAEKLRDRVAKLEGKIAIFKIGGINDSIKEETEFRIEDAINSTRHAYREGIVPGGGVTLIELSKVDGISDITREALYSTFKKLLENAGLDSEKLLQEVLSAKKGEGYDLKNAPVVVDMISHGVIDPVVVVRETLKNATGAAANAIKTGMGIIYTDTEK